MTRKRDHTRYLASAPSHSYDTPFNPSPYTEHANIVLRGGDVVVFRRHDSPLWQFRYRIANGQWHRQSTKRAALETAAAVACEAYDLARFRIRLGLAHNARSFAQIAAVTLEELRRLIDAAKGKTAYDSYVSCIERYFLPYFGDRQFEQLTHQDIADFELWRDRQMAKTPRASTLMNFASAWNRLRETGIQHGWLSPNAKIPKLTTIGIKSVSRPAFTRAEIDLLLTALPEWTTHGRLPIEKITRPLVRDYVEMLLYTGMRHGTEALGIRWQHVSWHTDKGVRYLRIWVDGKTGGRWLIAKHAAVDALKRLHERQSDIAHLSFDELLASNRSQLVFRCADLHQPARVDGMFKRLLKDTGLIRNDAGQVRTLYSLRHTYATLELLENGTDIHTLSRQMGNSVLMIERHYSKLTATMAAEQLA